MLIIGRSKLLEKSMSKFLYLFILLIALQFNCAYAKYVKLNDSFQIHYDESGLGKEVLLFIPGWTMSSKIFSYQLQAFSGSKKYRAIAYDPRGQGLSSKTESGYTYEQRGRDLHEFIKVMKLKNIVMVGWSFGTLDMLSYIKQFGDSNVKAAMVLDGSPKTMSAELRGSWAWIDIKDTAKIRQNTTMQVLSARQNFFEAFAKWMLDEPSPKKVKEISEISFQTPAYIAALTNETASYANYEKTLISFSRKKPLYIFVRDEWQKPAGMWIEKHNVKAKFSHMGKHLMFWEHYDRFNKKLENFLKELN